MEIRARRCLAVWYECPQCKRSGGYIDLVPSKRNRDHVGMCLYCDVPEVVTRRRYYVTWASDFYGTAGTCREVCRYYFPNIRVFRRVIAEQTAQREKEMREYLERERVVQAEYEAWLEQRRKEAVLLKEAEGIVHRVTRAAELEAGRVARNVWSEEDVARWSEEMDILNGDHPF